VAKSSYGMIGTSATSKNLKKEKSQKKTDMEEC
jgi:hypothetical protein